MNVAHFAHFHPEHLKQQRQFAPFQFQLTLVFFKKLPSKHFVLSFAPGNLAHFAPFHF
jgi:hypothetical protein